MENWGDFWVFWLLVLCILTIERDPILLTSFDTWGITIEQGGWFEGYHIPCSVTTFQHFKGLSCTFQHHPLSLQVSAWNRGVFHDHNAAAKNPILHYRKELWNPAKSKDKQLNHWCSFFSTTVVCEKSTKHAKKETQQCRRVSFLQVESVTFLRDMIVIAKAADAAWKKREQRDGVSALLLSWDTFTQMDRG